jgi:hypothetical protein
LRACWFPFGFPPTWLASPFEYTPWPVLQNVRQNTGNHHHTATSRLFLSGGRSFCALSLHRRLVSGSFNLPSQGAFQLSITLLLHYRSQDMFSLGGKCPPIPARFPTHGTQAYATSTKQRLRDYHPLWYPVPGDLVLYSAGLKSGLKTPHLHSLYRGGFSLGFAGFTRRY